MRFEDPMALYVAKKKKKAEAEEEATGNYYTERFGVSLEELRTSGYVIPEGTPSHSWVHRKVRPPENRFGIR